MPTYVTLIDYTQRGIEMLHDLEPDEVGDVTRDMIESQGGELVDFYLTMGEYDTVAIAELPDDQAAAGTLLNAGAMGIAETQTLTAFSEVEIANIVGDLGN